MKKYGMLSVYDQRQSNLSLILGAQFQQQLPKSEVNAQYQEINIWNKPSTMQKLSMFSTWKCNTTLTTIKFTIIYSD